MTYEAVSDPAAAPSRTSSRYTMTADLKVGLGMWQLWLRLAWLDVLQRYRRSALGPLWITLTMGVTIAGMGLVFGTLFGLPPEEYVPYLAVGIIVWTYMTSILNEANMVFITNERIIKNISKPYSIYIYRLILRNNFVLVHHLIIYFFVVIYFDISPGLMFIYIFPSIIIFTVCALSFSFILGLACARFRDVAPIVQNALQFIMYFTPIFWQASMLGEKRRYIVDPNPFYHFVEILRGPLLGYPPTTMNWVVTGTVAGGSLLLAFVLFRRGAKRLAYWI